MIIKNYFNDGCNSMMTVTTRSDPSDESAKPKKPTKSKKSEELNQNSLQDLNIEELDDELFPDTVPSAFAEDGPYVIDSQDGSATLTCLNTDQYSTDGGITWTNYTGVITLSNGQYSSGSIILVASDPQYAISLPAITVPCIPTDIVVSYEIYGKKVSSLEEESNLSEVNTIIECFAGVEMQVFYNANDSVNGAIVQADEFGNSSIGYSGIVVETCAIKTSPIGYPLDKMGPLVVTNI